jgi:hypothetical protein
MTLNEKSAAVSGIYSFSDVVDETCEKLLDSQIKYSIRRIHEMEELLCSLEKELDDFLFRKDKAGHVNNIHAAS